MTETTERKTRAPWTAEQVDALNAYQQAGRMHPFTCGVGGKHRSSPSLVATPDGWVCSVRGCDYTQQWAHLFMLDPDMGKPWEEMLHE